MKEQLSWIKRMLGAEAAEFPAEENAKVLRRMKEDGDDLTEARDIDFNHLFPNEARAIEFREEANRRGYRRVDHDFWPEEDAWLTSIHVRMVPVLGEITKTELALNEIARPFEGIPDGWGCMEVVPTETP